MKQIDDIMALADAYMASAFVYGSFTNTHCHTRRQDLRAAIEQALTPGPALVTKTEKGIVLHVGWDDLPVGAKLYQSPQAQKQQEPVAWEGGEGWESLAWELCADENGEEACNELIWEGGPIPEPWGDRWMKYEHEAKRLIALVHKHTSHQQQVE